MSFMEAVITEKMTWFEVDTKHDGIVYLPSDVCSESDALEAADGEPERVKVVRGYGVQSSAPGYLDCTPWTVYSNKREAMRAYREELSAND